jgi:peptide deformylase
MKKAAYRHREFIRKSGDIVTATDLLGNEFTEEAEGLYARCLQHEYDHIEGTTIVNRMSATAKITHRRQLKKLKEKHGEKT